MQQAIDGQKQEENRESLTQRRKDAKAQPRQGLRPSLRLGVFA
jgi:hypothetical protein